MTIGMVMPIASFVERGRLEEEEEVVEALVE